MTVTADVCSVPGEDAEVQLPAGSLLRHHHGRDDQRILLRGVSYLSRYHTSILYCNRGRVESKAKELQANFTDVDNFNQR